MTQATTGSAKVELPADEQILITREFNAPRHLVYRAYTTPEYVSRWWPSDHGSMKSCEIDLRVGGQWRYVMEANGGFEVGFHGEYREIVENERLVYTEIYEGVPGGSEAGLNTITFTENDGRTTMRILCEYSSKEVRDIVIESGMESGMQTGMDILEQIAIELAADG
jgi:uncharacterized protein YndB with AHSA1/START domain